MSQRRVLVLIDNIESDYQIEVISGVLRATRAANVNAVIVAGGWVSTDNYPTYRNFVYDFIPQAAVDGILVLAGSLSNHVGIAAFQKWLSRFAPVPIVCIGLEIEGRPSVFVDNAVGMKAAVNHLIEKHGRRKIGFFRGPRQSSEAEQRYAAYEQALASHGLAVDPQLICFGQSFGREDGHKAVTELFDQRGVDLSRIDAIACVNDDVALGAIEALTGRGIVVPDQIGLVGFDDAPNARAANPPLTTVNQCVELQGYSAGRALVEALESSAPAHSQRLDSKEVIRSSCGCQIPYQNDSRKVEGEGRGMRSLALAFLGRQMALKAEMARAAAGRLGSQSGWEERLLQSLSRDLQHADGGFRYGLEGIARRAIAVGGSIDPCNDVLTELRLQVVGLTGGQPELRPRVEDMFQEARLMLTQVGLSAYRERDQAATNHMRHIAKTCFETLGTGDAEPLSAALSAHLPSLGVAACTISRLSSGAKPRLEVLARVGTDFGSSRAPVLPVASLGLEQSLLHRAAVLLMPLDFNEIPVGLAAFAWGAHNPLIYEQLREVLNVAVYASSRASQSTPAPASAAR
jgi:DNA-binding LacI/PurR family transcriptional regulator